jgi:serine/threonine protein phosphatase 1
MKFLKDLFFGKNQEVVLPEFNAEIAPDQVFAVVGDIHGMLSLATKIVEEIDRAASESKLSCQKIIFVGDYIDRGEESRQVLNFLRDLQQKDPDRYICLRGNHEQMMLDFLDDPEKFGGRWLRNGGLQTLASFGVGGVTASSAGDVLAKARDSLLECLPKGLETWIHELPFTWQSGNVLVAHAGADPNCPVTDQHEHSLIWGHRDFLTKHRQDGQWVVHGHFIVDQLVAENGRINVDTSAYFSGELSAAIIGPGVLLFAGVSSN